MTTIIDVARLAGVSASTVSHVVNQTRFVSPETKRTVEAAIAESGYRQNVLARSLKTARSKTVGVAISTISNPYFSDIICSVEAECARLGLTVLLSDTQDDPSRELEVVQALHQRRVDGIFLAPSANPQLALAYIVRHHLACVLLDRMASDSFDQVGVTNREAMQDLVDFVVTQGHRRIGLIPGHPGFATTLERIEGFSAALARHHIVANPAHVAQGSATTDAACASALAILASAPAPTVLVGGNNLATIGIMRATRVLGLRVPEHLSVVGFDDFEWADWFEPRLTVVAQPCEELGRRAAGLLVDRISNVSLPPRSVRLPTRLIVRDSCGKLQ